MKYTLPATHYAAEALRRGPMTRERQHWRYRSRRFSAATINALVASGSATRVGNRVTKSAS